MEGVCGVRLNVRVDVFEIVLDLFGRVVMEKWFLVFLGNVIFIYGMK